MTSNEQRDQHGAAGARRGARAGLGTLLLFFVVFAGGIACVGRSMLSPDLEWRMLAMAGLAIAVSPFMLEARTRASSQSIPVPLAHAVLFAGSIALGPLGAALPAAFRGVGMLLFGGCDRRPLCCLLYVLLKPVVVCTVASITFVRLGGSVPRPHSVDSFLPVLAAAVLYVAASALLMNPAYSLPEEHPRVRARVLLAGWSLCLLGGYTLATLYAVAPSYVLFAPCVAAGLVGYALRQHGSEAVQIEVEAEVEPESPKSEPKTSGESNAFTDPVTGLANERYLMMFLQREISRTGRAGRQLSVAVFDLDDFRHMSQELADEALAAMGMQLKECVRGYDLIARHASHRLLLVLPEAPAQEAYEIAVRLHQSATSALVRGKSISASVGIATYPEHGSTPEELINTSHRVLNHGRYMGPNSVHASHKLSKAG